MLGDKMATLNCDRLHNFIVTIAILSFLPSAGLADNQITEEQAIHQLTTWIKSNRYYDFPLDCLRTKSLGHKNAGYTFELVAEGCLGNSPEGVVGRWRVDAKTAEIYVQNGAGKYVSPQLKNKGISQSLIREEHTVIVNSVREKWRLVWCDRPRPICSPDEWSGCPCTGFAFGEYGQLDLIRARSGAMDERFPLTQLYDGEETPAPQPAAVLSRWPVLDGDYELSQTSPDTFGALVRARAPKTAMRLGDYDHDGRATEFPLQVGAGPCGYCPTILVGISRRFPYLHAFGTVLHPKEPLGLHHPSDWDTVLHGQRKVTLVQISCGNHGAEEQTELELRFDEEGIHATRIVYSCGPGPDFSRAALKSREEF